MFGWDDIISTGLKIIDKVIPDPAAKAEAQLKLLTLQQDGQLAELKATTELALGQIGVNQAEASNASTFVSGGRPFVIWVGGVGLAYASIVEPIARFVAAVVYQYTGAFPVLDTTITMQILFGLLGLGAMRSYDKKQGTA